jgi:hypothetical protein
LKQKYGDSVTYEEDRLAHVKTEFGFDVLEVRMDVTLRIVTMTSSALSFRSSTGISVSGNLRPRSEKRSF